MLGRSKTHKRGLRTIQERRQYPVASYCFNCCSFDSVHTHTTELGTALLCRTSLLLKALGSTTLQAVAGLYCSRQYEHDVQSSA